MRIQDEFFLRRMDDRRVDNGARRDILLEWLAAGVYLCSHKAVVGTFLHDDYRQMRLVVGAEDGESLSHHAFFLRFDLKCKIRFSNNF
jgi:hypothetical protein